MSEEKKLFHIDDEALENVAGGVIETTYGNPNKSRHNVGDYVHFWDDNNICTDGYVQSKRWDLMQQKSEC